eukprot:TRINITY_DN2109_c3_g1_i1.p1 TRINITY_DN2109_c3_g1~~TRINITY_DN2109_c3_g1_i1.p1  ORF type:complete len:514 (+),score=135.37 TRINITY_DN2109_c3_g1_i1:119-1543(+)
MPISVSVYECIRGVKRVSTLQKEDITNGSKLGVLPAAVSLLVSDKHLEFAVVLEGKRGQESAPIWMGFHFYGQLENIQRCFRKKITDLQNIAELIHSSLVSKLSEPYSCPILVIGENSNKAFWQVSVEPNYSDILGYIPLLRTEFFHTIKSYPIIFSEGGDNIGVIVVGDVDRNHLLPQSPNLDAAFTKLLQKLGDLFGDQKWWYVLEGIRNEKKEKKEKNICPPHLEYICKWIIKKAEKSSSPTLVGNASIWRKGVVKDVQLVTLATSESGKSHFVFLIQSITILQSLQQALSENGVDINDEKIDNENVDDVLDDIVNEMKAIKNLTHQGTAIYNPFFERTKDLPPAFVLDNHTIVSVSSQSSRCDLPIPQSFLKFSSNTNEEKTETPTLTTTTKTTSISTPPSTPTKTPSEKKIENRVSTPSHDRSSENARSNQNTPSTLTTQVNSLSINAPKNATIASLFTNTITPKTARK